MLLNKQTNHAYVLAAMSCFSAACHYVYASFKSSYHKQWSVSISITVTKTWDLFRQHTNNTLFARMLLEKGTVTRCFSFGDDLKMCLWWCSL